MNTRILSFGAAIIASASLFGQNNQLSFGVDLGFPQGDFGKEFSMAVGPTGGFELPVGGHIGITAQVGYDILLLKDDIKEVLEGATLIPMQAGLKYYFQESQAGFYAHGQVGVHMFSEKFKENDAFGLEAETESNTNFSWAIGLGYQLQKLDLGVRYNSISPKEGEGAEGGEAEAFSYIGLRIAYLLNL